MRLSRRALLAALFALSGVLLTRPALSQRLWNGARYTEADRRRAVRRGLASLYRIASDRRHFQEHGSDLLWCLFSISRATAEPDLKRRAWTMGQERARHWRKLFPRVSEQPGAGELYTLAYGSFAADCLDIRDERMKADIERAVVNFGPVDFLLFDPLEGPAPPDVPGQCQSCASNNPRGQVKCRTCGNALTMKDPYELLCDALVTSYVGDSYGVTLGRSLTEVMRAVPKMRPYGAPENYDRFASMAYAITHVVYALNDYSVYRLKPEWLPQEFAFLKEHLKRTIDEQDAELAGEFLDTLKSFGLTYADPVIRAGVEFVLSEQNADGSWGDPQTGDIYDLYHSTWTAVCGLMDYAWHREGVRFPEALQAAS